MIHNYYSMGNAHLESSSHQTNSDDNPISISISNNMSYDSNSAINSPNQNIKSQSTSYSLLSSSMNQDNTVDVTKNKRNKKKNKKKKKKKKSYFKNIVKKNSIIGLFLNLFLWIWLILYILDRHEILVFPRASSDKKMDFIFAGANNDSFLGSFLSSLLCTILNYIICFIYPEIILFLAYVIYIVFSLKMIKTENFKENNCLLSKNTYKFLVILGLGEIFKLFARFYIDI